ncbi:MAG: S9 family peptidase [Lewinellaceae bacterium]|nr:S9 family peptidase [Lewinellaceae bacterium]
MKPQFLLFLLLAYTQLLAQPGEKIVLEPLNIFDLEFVSDPQISPDGQQIAYVRNFKDIMTDGNRSNLWLINFDGTDNRPLTSGNRNDNSPRWSPDGKKLLYLSSANGSTQLYLRWLDDGAEAQLTNLTESPGNIQWSPDGQWIAFTMNVPYQPKPLVKLPSKPEGAKWTAPPVYIDKMKYRADGQGYLEDAYTHLFLLSVDGGYARQLTSGDFNHNGGFCWSANSQSILFSANRHDDWEYEPANTEIYEISIADASIRPLTKRLGPDNSPKLSPDGSLIAYTGHDERYQGYQLDRLYVMNHDGKNPRLISGNLDRDVDNIQWSADGKGLYFQYDDEGNTKIAHINLEGKISDLAKDVGGLSLGRPYSGGQFTVASNGRFAFTHSTPNHPADLAVGDNKNMAVRRLTRVNDGLFSYKKPGEVEAFWYESSYDGRRIQGWICKPPGFDPAKKYPLILEIHGGPFTNYGSRYSVEVQLYAAAGYVVLYTNPRGSTSYGEEFGNLIHHNYPGQDYDDLMSGVDAVIAKGYIDEENLFVTGGSGGGVLTAWIVGKTDRFRAAVVAKPVINWYSFVLTSDNPAFFYKYWFPGFPWDHLEQYMSRSPISLVGNVKTPTMLMNGEQDYRTPISEAEQYYAALKLNKVETALVRIQDSGHGIANKPSNLMNKVVYILGWFERYREGK